MIAHPEQTFGERAGIGLGIGRAGDLHVENSKVPTLSPTLETSNMAKLLTYWSTEWDLNP